MISATPAAITYGQSAVFTATVQGSAATPTGNVQFFTEGSLGTSAPLGPPVPLVNGSATSSPQHFVHGVSAGGIQAEYFGDAQYTGGFSPLATFSVTSIPAPAFLITPSDLSLKAGQTTGNTSTLTITSQNNCNGQITFTCKVAYTGSGTVNDLPTSTLGAPATLTLSPAAPNGSLTATLNTIAPSGGVAAAQTGSSQAVRAGVAGLAGLLSMVMLASGSGQARRGGLLGAWLVLVVLLGLAGSITGCGGGAGGSGGSSTTPSPVSPYVPGTTPGSYIVFVTGASQTYTATTQFNLTVQ